MKKSLLLSVTLLLSVCLHAQQTFTFCQRDTTELKLDVYHPANPRADHACVLYVFGGGFISGARNNEHMVNCCTALSDRGFIVVAIDYRLYLKHAKKVPLLKMHTLFDTAILPPAAALPAGFRPAAVVPYAGGLYCSACQLKYAVPPAPTCFFHGTADRIVNYNSFRGSLGKALFGANRVARVFKRNDYSHWILRYEDHGHEIAAALPQTIDGFCAFVNAALAGRVMNYDATCTDSGIKLTKWSKLNLLQLYRAH